MRRILALTLVMIAALAACNDDGTSTRSTGGGGDAAAALEAAVIAYVAAFADGDADGAWAMVSQRCRGVVPEADYRAAVIIAGGFSPEMAATRVSVEVEGDRGRASYETGVTEIGAYDEQPWRFEDGSWRWDAC